MHPAARLGEHGPAQALLHRAVERDPGNLYATLDYLEFLLLTEDDDNGASGVTRPDRRTTLVPVVVEL